MPLEERKEIVEPIRRPPSALKVKMPIKEKVREPSPYEEKSVEMRSICI
jgi:hypothetical protein